MIDGDQLEQQDDVRLSRDEPIPSPTMREGGASRFSLVPADIAFLILALVVAIWHLKVLRATGQPIGLDFGNWLTIGYHLLGMGLAKGSHSVYPPLVPVLAVAFVRSLGTLAGTTLLASIASAGPAIGVYVVLRRAKLQWSALALASILLAARSTGEPTAWGGIPQLIGLGIGIVVLDSLARLLRSPSYRAAWRLGLLVLALAASSHLVLAQVTFAAIPILAIAYFNRTKSSEDPENIKSNPTGKKCSPWGLLLRVIIPSLPLVPIYYTLLITVASNLPNATPSSKAVNILQIINQIFLDAEFFWREATIVAICSPIVYWARRSEILWQVSASVTVTTVLSLLFIPQIRFAYFLPIGISLSLALWVKTMSKMLSQTPAFVSVTVRVAAQSILVLVAVLGLRQFPQQRNFYGVIYVPSGSMVAIKWLRNNTPANSLIAVPGIAGTPFGWWIEGYARRAALVGSSLEWLNFPVEQTRARESNALFASPADNISAFFKRANHLGVDYLYFPNSTDAPGIHILKKIQSTEPSLIVYRGSGAEIVRTPTKVS